MMKLLGRRRWETFLAVVLLSSVCVTTPVAAQGDEAPSWGTGNTHVLNLLAINFRGPGSISPNADENYFAFNASEYAATGVSLPSGAKVIRLEAVACDESAVETDYLSVYFRDCEMGAEPAVCTTWPTAAGITTEGAPGCGTFAADFDGPTIDNGTRVYIAEFKSTPPGDEVRIQLVRLFYELQISPAPAVATFVDVPVGSFAFQHIEALASSGITSGCGGGYYCPEAPVTRAQIAVFLAKALGLYWEP